MLSIRWGCRGPGKCHQSATERKLMVPAIDRACQSVDCRLRVSAVSESVEAKGPELKTLAQFERTGIEKLRRRYVSHLFPNLLDQSVQGFRTNLRSVGHALSFY